MGRTLGLVAAGALVASVGAHAQLTSVDGGLAVEDGNGLMFANTIGLNEAFSPTGGPGTGQGWVAQLNAENYGGFDDWTLATGTPGAANSVTNQLGTLFYSDCGNSAGSPTSMSGCGAFSSLTSTISKGMGPFPIPGAALFMGSLIAPVSNYYSFNVFDTTSSTIRYWDSDTSFIGQVGLVDSIAVRDVAAPEMDPKPAIAALTLLLGALAIRRERQP
jgi:hypothetical protein